MQVLSNGVVSYRNTSAADTAQSVILDLKGAHDTLAIYVACSGGTAALGVAGSYDGSVFLTLDSIGAAAPQVKQYVAATVGATIALSPLSFRYVLITVGTAGGGNTTTLTVSAK